MIAVVRRPQREPRPPRVYVDFNVIPAEQIEIDRRLANWAKWGRATPRREGSAAPGFGLVKSDEWTEREYGALTIVPIDHKDAMRIAVAVGALPDLPRKAIHWAYLKPYNPSAKAGELRVELEQLAALVIEGRAILIESGV